jgi:F0F1-type ATP synthase assembly protein I
MSNPVEDEALQFVETLAAQLLGIRAIFWGAWLGLLCNIVATLLPSYVIELTCLGICASFASMAWIWRKSKT